MPVTYCDEAYNEVMTWTEKTKIAYAPNRKSGKSFHRYGKYMKAKTVGEALTLGSYPLDLLFDYEKRLLKATGGPKRKQPPDTSAEAMSKEERKKLCRTDIVLASMYAKWQMWKHTFKALDEHGMTREQLKQMNKDQDPEGGKDSIVVAIGRREAQQKAKEILAAAGSRKITDYDVLECLRLWGFKENTNRGNVMPEGAKFVHSDTVGLIKMSTCERTLLTVGTKRYPEFTQLITRWLRERLPSELKQEFAYTSININKNYAGKLHRDGNNVGPSFIKAFGDFTNGELNYWPSDSGKGELESLKDKDKVKLNIRDNLMLFDGNRGHFVDPFKGERYSLVFFSIRTWNKAPKAEADAARKCGIPVPTAKSMAYAQSLLGPSGKSGYQVWPSPQQGSKGQKKSTACDETPRRGTKRTASPSLTPSPPSAKQKKTATSEKVAVLEETPKKINVASDFPGTALLHCTEKGSKSEYIQKRCAALEGKTVQDAVNKFQYSNAQGTKQSYTLSDLRYDVAAGRITVATGNSKAKGKAKGKTGRGR